MAEIDAHRVDALVEDMYRTYYEPMVRAALRYLDTRHLAEEAVQESFIRFRRSVEVADITSSSAYLRTIVLNTARSMLRRRQCAERWRPEMPVHATTPDESVLKIDLRDQVRQACNSLPEQQRRVLELRYWSELSEAEIASRLSISTGSVKTHASRGRAALRVALAEAAA